MRIASLLLLVSIGFSASVNTLAGERDLAEFRAAYPPAAERLTGAYSRSHQVAWLRLVDGQPLTGGKTTRFEFLIHDKLRKVTMTRYRGQDRGEILPVNDSVVVIGGPQEFRLHRDLQKSDGYVVLGLENSPVAEVGGMKVQFRATGRGLEEATFATQQIKMLELLDKNICKIASVEPVPDRPERTVRVKFSDAGHGQARFWGTAEFLPGREWALSNCELQLKASITPSGSTRSGLLDYTVKSSIEYGESVGGVPVPVRVRQTDEKGRTLSFEFESVSFDTAIPESEFALRSFGLPDLSSPVRDPSKSYMIYWMLGVAAFASVSALGIRLKWGRRDL